MKQFCVEQFRDWVKGKDGNHYKELIESVNIFLEENINKDYKIDTVDERWEGYGISIEEKEEILSHFMSPEKMFLIDLSLNQMKIAGDRDRFIIDFMNQNTKGYFLNLINTKACWYGVINELYLAVRNAMSKEEKLRENMCGDTLKCAKDYLKNRRNGKSNMDEPFENMVDSIDGWVGSFGSDIVRFWTYSKMFRNLLQWKKYDSNKYKLSNYLSCEFEFIENTEENNLILNKLIGGNVVLTYYKMLYPYLIGFEKNYINYIVDFIKTIMECESDYLCCEIIRFIGTEMLMIQNLSDDFKVRRFKLYLDYLKEIIPILNCKYKRLLEMILMNFNMGWDFDEWKGWIYEQKKLNDLLDPYLIEYPCINIDVIDNDQMSLVIKLVLENCYRKYVCK